ncbi:hypothetical protein [Pseudomonas sp. SDO55104_S430]
MKHYQDTETGCIYGFEDDIDPFTLNNPNLPVTLSKIIKPKPDETYVWYQGDWMSQDEAPPEYEPPAPFSLPSSAGWTAYLRPYSAVHRDETSNLNISLLQVNTNSYNGGKLAEVVTYLPLNIPSGLPALISYDGAIVIPQCDEFPDKSEGVKKLNEILCSLLLGGIHTEILPVNESAPSILRDGGLFTHSPCFHGQLRHNWASPSERMQPLMHPRVLMVSEIQEAYNQGQMAIHAVPNLHPFFLLNGFTSMIYRNTSDALSNLWIAVEQLTDHLWKENYTKHKSTFSPRVAKFHRHAKGNNKKIENICSKHQLLRLSKIISKECYVGLKLARLKRNKLVHTGAVPTQEIIERLWCALPELIEQASNVRPLGARRFTGSGMGGWTIGETNHDEWKELASHL